MRYFVQYGKKNHIIAIGTGAGGTEITKVEYDEIMAIIQTVRAQTAKATG